VTSYYDAGSTRIAERRTGYGSNNGLFWLTGDHLGSTSVTANSSGTKTAEVRYKPWGYILSIGKKMWKRVNTTGWG